MDLKTEIRLALYGTQAVTKIDVPPDFTPFQIAYSKFYSLYTTSYETIANPATIYAPVANYPTRKKVLVKVNPSAVFPCDGLDWTLDDYTNFVAKTTAWGLFHPPYSDLFSLVTLNSYAIANNPPDHVYALRALFLGKTVVMRKAEYLSIIANLSIVFNEDLTSYSPVIASDSNYQFNPDLILRLKKTMTDYLNVNLEKYYKYRRMGYTKTQADEARALAKELVKTNYPYIEVFYDSALEFPISMHEHEILITFVNNHKYNSAYHVQYKGFDFSKYKLISHEVLTQLGSYTTLPVVEVKYIKFASTVKYLEPKIGDDIRPLALAAIEVGKKIIAGRTVYQTSNFGVFNTLIAVRDHYTKYQSTGFLFSGGDMNIYNAYKSGNIQAVLTSQLPMLVFDVITTKKIDPKGTNIVATENLLKFIYICTMGYLKTGQVVTSNLQPYFSVGDTQQSAYNRLVAISPIQNGVYVWPSWVKNIMGTDIVPENTPNGAMVVKVINDVLKEADAFFKNFS